MALGLLTGTKKRVGGKEFGPTQKIEIKLRFSSLAERGAEWPDVWTTSSDDPGGKK
jgi:hypothetical protein